MRRTARWYYGWAIAGTLGVTETISWGIVYYAFSAFLPVMEADLGWSRGETSGAFSLGLLVSGLSAPFVGRWLDRHGPRVLMTFGACLGTGLVLAWAQMSDLRTLYLIWGLMGLVMAMVLYDPAFATMAVWFEQKRARALFVITLMAGLASTIFLPLAGWLIATQTWRPAVMWLGVILGVGTILPHALVLRRRPEDLGLRVDGVADDEGAASVASVESRSLGFAMRDHTFWWLVAAFSVSDGVAVALRVHLVAYLIDRGFDLGVAAALTGTIGAMQVVGRLLLGVLGNRLSARKSAVVLLGIQPFAIGLLWWAPGLLGVWGFVVVFGSVYGALTLVRPMLLAALFGRARYASIAGVQAVFITGARALGPIGAGLSFDLAGTYQPLLLACLLLSLVLPLAVQRARR